MAGYLIWDFDGTLGHRVGGMWTASVLEVLSEHNPNHGIDYDGMQAFVRGVYTWSTPEIEHGPNTPADEWWAQLHPVFVRAYVEGAGIPLNVAEQLAPKVRGVYTSLDRWALFPDTLPALEELSMRGWRHVLLSNHVPELRTILEYLGVTGRFDAIYNSAETGLEKPNPKAFRNAVAGLPGSATLWMIGDNPVADVEGAEAVGIPGILVRKERPGVARQCADLKGVGDVVGDAP